jgi:hypothetical protein
VEHVGADLILPERGTSPPLPLVQPHQCAMRALLERIDPEQRHCVPDGRRNVAAFLVVREQRRVCAHRPLANELALGGEPTLERLLVDGQALEEVATVQRHGPRQRARRSAPGQLQERAHVTLHARRIEHHGARIADQRARSPERLADQAQRLPQRRPRPLRRGLRPEERRELLARLRLTGVDRQVREQCLGLLRGKTHRCSGADARLKAPEQRRPHHPHCRSDPITPVTLL